MGKGKEKERSVQTRSTFFEAFISTNNLKTFTCNPYIIVRIMAKIILNDHRENHHPHTLELLALSKPIDFSSHYLFLVIDGNNQSHIHCQNN